jgi:hypothetical protein
MRGSKGAIVRGFGTGQVPAQPHARTSSNRNGIEDSAPEPAEDVSWGARQLPRNDETTVQSAPGHSVRGSRNMKGVQPFACI